MFSVLSSLTVLVAVSSWAPVHALTRDGRAHANVPPSPVVPTIPVESAPVTSRNGTTLPPYTFTYYFDQLIDHNNPSLGTFQQRFWHTYEFYEPGGPIILMTPGEVNAQGIRTFLYILYPILIDMFSIFRLPHQSDYQWSYCTTAKWIYYCS